MTSFSVTRAHLIEAPQDAAWQALADFGNVHRWSSDLVGTRLDGPIAPGVRRHCELARPFLGQSSVTEQLRSITPGTSLAYEVVGGHGPFRHAESRWELDAVGERTRVTADARFVTKGRLLGPVTAWLTRGAIGRLMAKGLAEFAAFVEAEEGGAEKRFEATERTERPEVVL